MTETKTKVAEEKTAKTAETKGIKIDTCFEEVEGCGVLVTKTYGNTISTVFVPGAKVRENKLVSIISA